MSEEKELTGYPSIDKPWLKYYSEEAINAPLPECTIYEDLMENNRDHPEDIAILYLGRKIRYGELLRQIDRTAAAFAALGVKPGEIVTVTLPSIPEALYVVYALNKIGAVSNMIHPLAGEQEILNYLNEVQSEVAVLFDGTYNIIKDSIGQTKVKQAVVVTAGESLPFGIKQLYAMKNPAPRFAPGSVFLNWKAFLAAGANTAAPSVQKDPHTMALISHTGGIDVFLDGHSHDTDHVTVKNKDGNEVLRAACGTKLAAIGWCRITADGEISTGLYTWNNKVAAPELLGIDNEMSRAVAAASEELNKKLGEVVASAAEELTINDPTEVLEDGTPIRMIRRAETNLGDFCADAYRAQSGADIAFVNGGGIRVSIPAGDITLNNILSVHPFGNSLCVIEVKGQQILDALEWGSRAVPNETGGFLQVSGLTYEIHSYIDSPCQFDENGLFAGVQGERRVKNVLVGGEPIDPDKLYTLASHDYMLLSNGDGFSMFDGATLLQDRVKLDNQVLIDYITESLGGMIGEEYEDPYGQGRIVIVNEEP